MCHMQTLHSIYQSALQLMLLKLAQICCSSQPVSDVQATPTQMGMLMGTMATHPATPSMPASRPPAAIRQALLDCNTLYTMRPLMTGPFQEKAILIQHLHLPLRRLHKERTGVRGENSSEGAATCLTCIFHLPWHMNE